MSLHSSLRALIRRMGLHSLVSPLVTLAEEYNFRRLGSYSVKHPGPGVLEFTGYGRTLRLEQLPASQCDLGLSKHERPTIQAILSRVPTGGVAWDVGANVGFYSRLMAAAAGETGQIIAFEPNPATFAELQRNLEDHVIVKALCKGLSNADGSASFATPADHSSASRIMATDTPALDDFTTIATARGDSLVAQEHLPVPHFIKLDIEGHELQALQGLAQTLAQSACRCVLVEVHFGLLAASQQPDAPTAIRALLSDCGLSCQRWIARSHLLAERL